jgi:hypothetical protein
MKEVSEENIENIKDDLSVLNNIIQGFMGMGG